MYQIYTTVEIAASPEHVRSKFLDFSQIPKYHPNGFFKSISPAVPNKKLESGDKMENELAGLGTIKPTLLENSPECFRWGGNGLMGTFNGEHIFRFQPSTKTPGGTTFVQEEVFTGALTFMIGEGFVARKIGMRDSTQKGFESFNQDLKKWCESS